MCITRLLTISQNALLGVVYLLGGIPAWGVPAHILPPENRMTDRSKNITLPQTLFVGSKNMLIPSGD